MSMTARRDGNYLKEILGTILWIALIYFLLQEDGVARDGVTRIREFLEHATH